MSISSILKRSMSPNQPTADTTSTSDSTESIPINPIWDNPLGRQVLGMQQEEEPEQPVGEIFNDPRGIPIFQGEDVPYEDVVNDWMGSYVDSSGTSANTKYPDFTELQTIITDPEDPRYREGQIDDWVNFISHAMTQRSGYNKLDADGDGFVTEGEIRSGIDQSMKNTYESVDAGTGDWKDVWGTDTDFTANAIVGNQGDTGLSRRAAAGEDGIPRTAYGTREDASGLHPDRNFVMGAFQDVLTSPGYQDEFYDEDELKQQASILWEDMGNNVPVPAVDDAGGQHLFSRRDEKDVNPEVYGYGWDYLYPDFATGGARFGGDSTYNYQAYADALDAAEGQGTSNSAFYGAVADDWSDTFGDDTNFYQESGLWDVDFSPSGDVTLTNGPELGDRAEDYYGDYTFVTPAETAEEKEEAGIALTPDEQRALNLQNAGGYYARNANSSAGSTTAGTTGYSDRSNQNAGATMTDAIQQLQAGNSTVSEAAARRRESALEQSGGRSH